MASARAIALIKVAIGALSFLGALAAHAESPVQNPLQDLVELTPDELATFRGGFIGPNGLAIDVGLEVQTFVEGRPNTDSGLTSPTAAVPIASAELAQIGGQGPATSILSYTTALTGTVVLNTVNNAAIQQLRQLNISVDNFTKLQAPAALGISQVNRQINSFISTH